MKKIILILSIIFCCNLITAQGIKDYQVMVHMIDSMKNEYSMKELINSPMVKCPYQYRELYKNLTKDYQNKVIDCIYDLYNQEEYFGLYSLACVLLDEYYNYSKEEIRKRIIDVWFEKSCYSSFSITDLGRSQDYSEKTKQRLLDILSKKWTQEDIAIWEKRSEQALRQYYINDYKEDVKKIMKKTNQHGENVEEMLLDSIIQDGVNRNMKENINRPISQSCILMIGSLNDKRFVSALESMIEEYKENEDHHRIKEFATYALAKLGVQKYLDVVYNSEYIPYRYLGTKEAYLKYLDKMFVWNKGGRAYTYEKFRPSALAVLDETIMYNSYLKNVPDKIKKEHWSIIKNYVIPENFSDYDPSKDEQNKESIQKAYLIYNWIKDNQNVWEIPPANDY